MAFGCRLLLTPWRDDRSLSILHVPVGLFAAGFGGWGPGLLATAFGFGVSALFRRERLNFGSGDLIDAAGFHFSAL